MLAKLRQLLTPLANLKNKATILRIGLAGVVLGVGGFAVYKGVQQMKPGRPTPKPTTTAVNKLKKGQKGDLDPTSSDTLASVQVVSGQTVDGDPSASLYPAGDEQNPAMIQNQYAGGGQVTDYPAGGNEGGPAEGGVPQSPLAEDSGDEQNQYGKATDDPATAATVPSGRLRNVPTGSSGAYGVSDQGTDEGASQGQNYGANTADGSAGQNQRGESNVADGGQHAPLINAEGSYGGGVYRTDSDAMDAAGADGSRALRAPQTLPGVATRRGQSDQASTGSAIGSALRSVADDSLRSVAASIGGAGVPGDRQFEGTQVPSVAIEKFAPAEIQVGKSATFEIRVRNAGQVPAHDVVVTDQVPRGTKLEATSPEAQVAADGSLAWQIGAMQPGDEVVLSMQVLPEQEGEIGSVAQLTFAGRATARSVCTRPLLSVEHTAPKQVLIGETVRLGITISNPGTGAATGVIVEEDVPEGLTHIAGSELEYEIGTLRPGETRQLELQLTADKAGVIENMVTVRGEGNLIAQHKVQIEVIAPQLEVAVTGPKRRYLERQATYTLSIENPGTAAARSVELVAYLPKGMKFFSTDAEGRYDPAQHAVFWSLEELPASKSGSVNLVAVPVETGEQRLRVEGKADLGLSATSEQAVQVEARSELVFDIVDVNDPIEVGTDTTYEIRVANNGTRPATAVELAAGFPERGELKPVSAEGHSRGTVQGQQVIFEPVGRINPGEEVVFRIRAQGQAKGDHVIAVQIRSAEFPLPVTREESTRVYDDQ